MSYEAIALKSTQDVKKIFFSYSINTTDIHKIKDKLIFLK